MSSQAQQASNIPPGTELPTILVPESARPRPYLADDEIFWRDRYFHFERHGYRLRPRYHPDWVPSWYRPRPIGLPPITSFYTVEDSRPIPARRGHLFDATRISDGKLVYMKRVRCDSSELKIMKRLSEPQMRRDPRNNCIPLLSDIQDPFDPTFVFMVMPYLRQIDSPPFETIGEFVQFVSEMISGLAFMHEHGIAHRDCYFMNLGMDSSKMFPEGFHPIITSFLPDLSGAAYPLPRSVAGVRYYFTDFGLSVEIPLDQYPKLATGTRGQDGEPPELHSGRPYDPFKLDIFILGNCIRRWFLDVYSSFGFLEPLIAEMTRLDPMARPDAPRVVEKWDKVRRSLSIITRNWPLRKRDESISGQIATDVYGLVKLGLSRTSVRRYLP